MPSRSQANSAKRKARKRSDTANAINIEQGAYRTEEARIYLGCLSLPTFNRLIRNGLIRPNKHIGHNIFSRKTLDDFLAQTR